MNEKTLKALAKVYVNHKPELIRLMNDGYGSELPEDVSHLDVIREYKYLLDNSANFREDIDALMVSKKIISPDYEWNNTIGDFFRKIFSGKDDKVSSVDSSSGGYSPDITVGVDPISAIAGAIGTIFGGISAMKTAKTQQEIEQDRFLFALINEQNKSNTNTILIITGITFVGIGVALYFIFKK